MHISKVSKNFNHFVKKDTDGNNNLGFYMIIFTFYNLAYY